MATVQWNNGKKHIEDLGETYCGREIPARGKEWSAFGEATCQRCLAAYKKRHGEDYNG